MVASAAHIRRACVVALVALASCGGESRPAAPDHAAELKRWATEVDAICEEARRDIAARGGPRDIAALDRVAARAIEDVRAAIDEIGGLRAPPRARPVLERLHAIEPWLDRLGDATEADGVAKLPGIAAVLESDGRGFARAARAAGLRECGDPRLPVAVSDAIIAPLYAIEVAVFNASLERRTRRATRRQPHDERQLSAFYGRVNRLWTRALRRWDGLIPPERAENAADAYGRVISDIASYAGEIAAQIDGGRRVTPDWGRRVQRRFDRLDARSRRAVRRLAKAVGARPGPLPKSDEEEIA